MKLQLVLIELITLFVHPLALPCTSLFSSGRKCWLEHSLTICVLHLQENGRTRSPTTSLASTLSKKTSQLVTALNPPSKRVVQSEEAMESLALNRMETAAAVMLAAKSLVNWMDRNPSSLISNYENFRQEMLKNALELSSILVSARISDFLPYKVYKRQP